MVVRSSSVSLPHFSLTLPLTCFQLPLMVSQFMTFLLGKVQHCNRCPFLDLVLGAAHDVAGAAGQVLGFLLGGFHDAGTRGALMPWRHTRSPFMSRGHTLPAAKVFARVPRTSPAVVSHDRSPFPVE